VNAENAVYHIPIDAAAALVLAEYATMGARGAADVVGDTAVASGVVTEESTETAGGNGS
jgi:hypothetical protein